jgi:hypothetical protein
MSLLVQFQCIYHIINRLLYGIPWVLRYIIQVLLGWGIGVLYFYGLVMINQGIIRFYFFVLLFLGYLFYQKYYAYNLLFYLEICVRILKRLISPFIFFFYKINAIIQKRVKRVKLKWRRKDSLNSKN